MINFLFIVGLVIQGYLLGFPGFFVQELAISFLPYILVVNTTILIIQLIIITRKSQKILFGIILLGYLITTFLFSYTLYISYYFPEQKKIIQQEQNTDKLNIFYANIYYQNSQTTELLHYIHQENSDVVMLVEYSKYHDETLTSIIKKDYPYVSRYVGSKGYDGDIIFSKYPLKKIDHTKNPGSFSHVTITYQDKNIDLALMHTSAPVSKKFFTMRNNQLQDLSDILSVYYADKPERNIVLAGDFNLTPRSSYYKPFDKSLQKIGLYNITLDRKSTLYDRPIPYTRCLEQAQFICAHIDHIWTTNTMNLKLIPIQGSDHYGMVGSVDI